MILIMEFSPTSNQGQLLHISTVVVTQESSLVADSNNVAKRFWSDLPTELLESIARRLGIVEFLGFRGACKEWRSASFNSSAEIESTVGHDPYFLCYGNSSHCHLYDPLTLRDSYTIRLPELKGASCLASNGGWLLVYREGSVFFFCPFSRAKVDLPQFPHPRFSDHVAAFSSPPTSPDCIVGVINRSTSTRLELNLLWHGANEWTKYEYFRSREDIDTITCAIYCNGSFYFLDSKAGLVTYSIKDKSWTPFRVVRHIVSGRRLPFARIDDYFSWKNMDQRIIFDGEFSISICGTQLMGHKQDICIHNESVCVAYSSSAEPYQLKGVWIQPRFHQLPLDYSWSS